MCNNKNNMSSYPLVFILCCFFGIVSSHVFAAPSTNVPRKADIRSTKHNLSTTGQGDVKALTESQVCVFCHTPHGANDTEGLVAPLWNRNLAADGTYIRYDSNSTQANIDNNPGGSSKLCLSCHDGTIAIGNVNVLGGNTDVSIDMLGTDAGMMPSGNGTTSGFTRDIGTSLENDHPISFSFDTSKSGQRLALADGELRDPQNPDGDHIAIPSTGNKPLIPLDHQGKVQCTSCHDPHVSGQDLPPGTSLAPGALEDNIKFLRGRRFQMSEPVGGLYNESQDSVCLACHDKLGQAWANSAHAKANVADEVYNDADADLRGFPRGIKVWQAACLNCHDTHTVEGSRRLLREGTDNNSKPKTGGNAAIEETCYQCHDDTATGILKPSNNQVPDIKTEFSKSRKMPITNIAQPAGMEVHDIKDADFTEDKVLLGYNNLMNRHAECTDCHNPHRMLKNTRWDGTGSSTRGTHEHTAGTSHTNEISGVLYGTWGVEPIYGSDRRFGRSGAMPIGFTEKKGIGVDRVTAEYQICLKCHSNYGFNDDGSPESNTRPEIGAVPGTTPYDSSGQQMNSLQYYTNQAMEFQANILDQGEGQSEGFSSGASSSFNANNHRSWHPVMRKTGRTTGVRGADASNFTAPFDNNVGNLTMYCTDCHGASNATASHSEPPAGTPWGPHGSNNNFILRGRWTRGQAQADGANTLCFKCHTQNVYTGTAASANSGFSGTGGGMGGGGGGHGGGGGGGGGGMCMGGTGNNWHVAPHRNVIGRNLICTWCHVAVPHGWKNKALLVNLNDIGPEVECRDIDNTYYQVSPSCSPGQPIAAGTRVTRPLGNGGDNRTGYNNPPYYINARLRVQSFAPSSQWQVGNCESVMSMTNNMCAQGAGY